MSLGKRQEEFSKLVPQLINKAHELGFEVRIGDVFRDPRVHGEYGTKKGYGSATSNHKLKCAIDLNLFKNGNYLPATTDHEELGLWWEQLDDRCRWGGWYNDGNHYEYLD